MTPAPSRRHREGGQILVIATLAMIAMVAGAALVVEGGNAAAQQRGAQNGADAAANAGASVLADRLAGNTRTDAQVLAKVQAIASQNGLGSPGGWYTNFSGQLLNSAGAVVTNPANAAPLGGGTIPNGARGVRAYGTRTFGTTLGRVIGFDTMDASADATAITGPLTGGKFLPVVFPINIVDCEKNGDLGIGEDDWTLSQPGTPYPPNGQEFIVPLCKTGGGSFMILDLDGNPNNCDQEVAEGIDPPIQWDEFPVWVDSDNGNNCAKQMVDEVNALHGETVLVPICDDDCSTTGGSKAEYHVVKVAAFVIDYMSEDASDCQGNGTTLVPIRGNGSSSCIAGWFVRYITVGPVGSGPVGNSDALGIQLIR